MKEIKGERKLWGGGENVGAHVHARVCLNTCARQGLTTQTEFTLKNPASAS